MLTKKQTATILSMGNYWKECAQRDNPPSMSEELGSVIHLIGADAVLQIVLEYAENYKIKNKEVVK